MPMRSIPDKTRVLSQAMFWGAVTAAISNVVVGALSDRTRSRFGRRRPWIAAGAC
ncbi:MFS transporter [Brevundimonas albigilva]|uniref:MFS transporter n=1 Tax=Brevundimonas albigilva TaxID=1312364 RepID=UPI00201B715F|nr:MFS transporter [Brevundimonas albigilva]UQV19154.1 MFS transporter [Brevundimonas albigilva]